jgi:hypothetical protein
MPRPEYRPAAAPSQGDGKRPGDDFDRRAQWSEILEPHGWKCQGTRGDGREHWTKPGKLRGTSATITPDGHLLYVFTTATEFDPERAYSKFGAFAVLNHGGDFKLAAKALQSQNPSQSPTKIGGNDLDPGYSAAELLKVEFPEPRFAVPGVLPEGLTILAGKPKIGKSWLVIGFGLAIASGGRALGHIEVEEGDVLYLGLEDTPRRLKRRLEALLPDGQGPERLRFHTTWPRSDEGGVERIEQWLKAHPEARLVVIDTLAKFRPLLRESGGYTTDYAAIAPLQSLAGKYGVTIVIVHHHRKLPADDWVDAINGTLGLAGAADGLVGIFRKRGSEDAELRLAHRDVDDLDLAIRFDGPTSSWTLLGMASEVLLSRTRRQVVNFLKKAGPMTPSKAAPLLGKTLGATKKLFWDMSGDDLLAVDDDGRYSVAPAPVPPAPDAEVL